MALPPSSSTPWHPADADRATILNAIVALLKKLEHPPLPELLPGIAEQFETTLCSNARSKAEYMDLNTLKPGGGSVSRQHSQTVSLK